MAFNINEFKGNLKYGGARSNLFQVKLTNPIDGSANQDISFKCKAANLPQRTVNPISVPYFGRNIKVAGTVQNYEDWTITVYNDEDYLIRNALEAWQSAINSPEGNIRRLAGSSPELYKATAEIISFGQVGQELRTYKFVGLWPTSVGEVQMDWGQENVSEFTCTFALDYWVLSDANITGNAGGSL